MPDDFSSCENFHNLRKFVGCEISKPTGIVHLLSCNSLFSVTLRFAHLKLKFYNLLSHSINGH